MNIEDLQQHLTKYTNELEISEGERNRYIQAIQQYAESFYATLPHAPAYQKAGKTRDGEDDFLDVSNKGDFNDILEYIQKRIDTPGINPASGGHLGYIPGGGLFEAALGDFIAAVSNRYAGVFFASPGAVRLENSLIEWAGKLIGYPTGFAGNLTSGGSIANLIAVGTAREQQEIKAKDVSSSVIYTTQQAHHSLLKAIRITGLGESVIRIVPMDSSYRMSPESLATMIREDLDKGLQSFMIISNAGSTDVGAVDPLNDIADIAAQFNLWHHVDAAYGGFFMLTDHGKKKLQGLERADSVVLDPHKGLFLPYGSGMVLVKDGRHLLETFSEEANYMQDTKLADAELSPADLSPELSKHFRGMRMWLPLKLHGVEPFKEALDEKLLLVQYFYHRIQKAGFEVGPEPDLSVAIFRYIPADGNANAYNQKLIDHIHTHCRIFISSTTLNGQFWLRAAILSVRTHINEVDDLIVALESFIKARE